MKKISVILIGLIITAWVYPIQAQVPITQEMIIHPTNTVVNNGNIKIYGRKAGKEAGFTFLNIYSNPVEINFDAYLTGKGTECFQRKRDLQIGEVIYELDTTVFDITIRDIADTITFLFTDGCASGYVPGQGWTNVVNVELNNFMVTTAPELGSLSIDEIQFWEIEIYRLDSTLDMEDADTLKVSPTGLLNIEIEFIQPLYRKSYEDQPDPITFARGDTLLDESFTIDLDSSNVVGDLISTNFIQKLALELGNWAWTARTVDTLGWSSKQADWQKFRLEEKETIITVRAKMQIRKE